MKTIAILPLPLDRSCALEGDFRISLIFRFGLAKCAWLAIRFGALESTRRRCVHSSTFLVASVAQLAEQLTLNQLVDSSSLSRGTIFFSDKFPTRPMDGCKKNAQPCDCA
jgi:hypothetical protein